MFNIFVRDEESMSVAESESVKFLVEKTKSKTKAYSKKTV